MVRTTIVLDPAARQAAKQLAARWGCSGSEAIRRALVAQRDAVAGQPPAQRTKRRLLLLKLCALFEGSDAAAEIAQRKHEDMYF